MAGNISYRSDSFTSSFLDPRKSFELRDEVVEVRFDPLTGRATHLAHFGALSPQPLDHSRYRDPAVKGFCPFCGENRLRVTPRFPEGILPEGRLSRGEALLVPNIFPYDAFSSVCILTEEHVVTLPELTKSILSDGISTGLEFLCRVRSLPGAPRYASMGWNYMPPSGGGLVHPHQQYFATDFAGNRYEEELRESLAFSKKHGESFWDALLREERKGERFIGDNGGVWFAPFAPLGTLGDIACVFPEVFCPEEFAAHHLESLVEGLLKLFRYFDAERIHSFNASLFWGPTGQRSFPAQLRVVPRTFLNLRDCAPDLNFFHTVFGQTVSVVTPEELAVKIRPFFLD